MFKLSSAQIDELSHFALVSDKETRHELSQKIIQDENDYTSNFTGAFRRRINAYSKTGLRATSIRLSPRGERKAGCDAAIIISSNDELKVALFEAKWPRISTPYNWDYLRTSKTAQFSHYSNQLDRQSHYWPEFAVFEMFYCEFAAKAQPQYMQDEGSTCVWHDTAMLFKTNYMPPNAAWSQSDLKLMLQNGNLSIEDIVRAFGKCDVGKAISYGRLIGITRDLSLPSNILYIDAGGNVDFNGDDF